MNHASTRRQEVLVLIASASRDGSDEPKESRQSLPCSYKHTMEVIHDKIVVTFGISENRVKFRLSGQGDAFNIRL